MARPWREIGRYGTAGIEFVVTILLVSALGHWIDGRLSLHGWGVGAGFLLGVTVAFRNLVRTAGEMQRDIERAEAKDPDAGRWTVDERWVHPDPDEPKIAPRAPRRPRTTMTSIDRAREEPGRFDARLRVAIGSVAVVGAGLSLGALVFAESRAAVSVAVGAALAVLHLWALARVVVALLPADAAGARAQSPFGWVAVGVLKMGGLLALVAFAAGFASVSAGGMVIGLLALPIGIAIGAIVSDRDRGAGDPPRAA